MSHYQVAGLVRQKDGSLREELQTVREPPVAKGGRVDQLPRSPRDFERWENGAWVTDEAAKARHEEDARLRRLSPAERQQEAVATAKAQVIETLRAMGVPGIVVTEKAR